MSIINKKNEQCLIDGAIQGVVVVGELYLLKEIGLTKKSQPMKAIVTISSVMASEFIMTWFKKQTFYPNV